MKKILIVEDEPGMVKLLSHRLTLEGYGVSSAPDGEAGLAMAIASHPDLILLDILMPKLHGLTLLRKVRMDEWGKDVPIIVMTNMHDPQKEAEVRNEWHCEYIEKSDWKLEDYVKKIKAII
ncbi:MAG: response regulator [Patescibacteria group bacterium]